MIRANKLVNWNAPVYIIEFIADEKNRNIIISVINTKLEGKLIELLKLAQLYSECKPLIRSANHGYWQRNPAVNFKKECCYSITLLPDIVPALLRFATGSMVKSARNYF